jgi:predicted nucleic acid-binding protein
LLEQLFEKVLLPVALYEELTDPRTPEAVRRSVLSHPAWLEVKPVTENQRAVFQISLHRGKREAILLMEALRADVTLD